MIHKEVPNRPYIFPGIFVMGPCQNYVLNVFRFLTGKVAIIPSSAGRLMDGVETISWYLRTHSWVQLLPRLFCIVFQSFNGTVSPYELKKSHTTLRGEIFDFLSTHKILPQITSILENLDSGALLHPIGGCVTSNKPSLPAPYLYLRSGKQLVFMTFLSLSGWTSKRVS